MRHLLDKHISIANSLDTYFWEFGGEHWGYNIFSNAPVADAEGRRLRYYRSTGVDTAVFGPSH